MTGLTTPINTYPLASTPLTGTETAIGTGADGVTTQQLQVSAIAVLGANQQSVSTIAALRALTSLSGGPGSVVVQSYAAPGDGGGGFFVYDANDTTTADNGGTIIVPTTTLTGRWYRLFSGALDIRWFGGVAGGKTSSGGLDNSAALTAAVASVSIGSNPHVAGPRVYFPGAPLSYGFASTQFFKKTVILEGDGVGLEGGTATILEWPANTLGLKFEFFDTFNNVIVAPTSGADASIVQNMKILGGGGTMDGISHGIDTRVRIKIRDCIVANFAGNQNNDLTGAGGLAGNANEGTIDTVTVGGGQHGLYFQGADTNAWTVTAFGVDGVGCAGVLDLSFLGNYYVGLHVDNFANLNLGRVTQGGHTYSLIDPTAGVGAATTPGTNNNIWYDEGAGSGPPAWSSGGTYIVSGAVICTGASCRSSFMGTYVEVGLPYSNVRSPSFVIQGQGTWTTFTQNILSEFGVGDFLAVPQGFGSYAALPAGDGRGTYEFARVGSVGAVFSTQGGMTQLIGPYPTSQTSQDLCLYDATNLNFVTQAWTGNFTTCQFGTGVKQPGIATFNKIALAAGLGVPASSARIMTAGTAAPTTGAHAIGEIVWNQGATAAGQPLLWYCTAAGTPGTWVVHNL